MRIESINRSVMKLDDAHPAKQFLVAFIECRANCVGQELGLGGEKPIDQEWRSALDGRLWTFSGFAYTFLSRDIDLEGFQQSILRPTELDTAWPWDLPRLKSLMNECTEAARQSGNNEILELTDQVLEMLALWEQYLSYRKEMVSRTHG